MDSGDKHPIKIRPLQIKDYEMVLAWSKDDVFCVANGWEINRSSEELHKWWIQCVERQPKDFRRMGVEYKERLIGYADLALINNHTAELGIAIGERGLWGSGFGSAAARCMMDYATENLGITILTAETHEENIRSQKLLEKIGFQEISRIGFEMYKGKENQLIQYRFRYE
ncbi:GNAT family N-acetyltransferase [Bacillus horti]|uniref:RimJ/RimL family protein N-acetyltransferase n=1 Tax=Caldalkalibacillus horti TaxID=77523 RepID=A0ABT9VX77_9BACI|nr:GNAT family N-acetyltransferase [Bacillus horti]MDQ0165596.1 RimJ/RimL family protein N-acetyltransferase [Bacillus horti]